MKNDKKHLQTKHFHTSECWKETSAFTQQRLNPLHGYSAFLIYYNV